MYAPVQAWTVEHVQQWLTTEGLGDYTGSFLKNGIDGPSLLCLTKQDLKDELDIASLLDRKRIWQSITTLTEPSSFRAPTPASVISDGSVTGSFLGGTCDGAAGTGSRTLLSRDFRGDQRKVQRPPHSLSPIAAQPVEEPGSHRSTPSSVRRQVSPSGVGSKPLRGSPERPGPALTPPEVNGTITALRSEAEALQALISECSAELQDSQRREQLGSARQQPWRRDVLSAKTLPSRVVPQSGYPVLTPLATPATVGHALHRDSEAQCAVTLPPLKKEVEAGSFDLTWPMVAKVVPEPSRPNFVGAAHFGSQALLQPHPGGLPLRHAWESSVGVSAERGGSASGLTPEPLALGLSGGLWGSWRDSRAGFTPPPRLSPELRRRLADLEAEETDSRVLVTDWAARSWASLREESLQEWEGRQKARLQRDVAFLAQLEVQRRAEIATEESFSWDLVHQAESTARSDTQRQSQTAEDWWAVQQQCVVQLAAVEAEEHLMRQSVVVAETKQREMRAQREQRCREMVRVIAEKELQARRAEEEREQREEPTRHILRNSPAPLERSQAVPGEGTLLSPDDSSDVFAASMMSPMTSESYFSPLKSETLQDLLRDEQAARPSPPRPPPQLVVSAPPPTPPPAPASLNSRAPQPDYPPSPVRPVKGHPFGLSFGRGMRSPPPPELSPPDHRCFGRPHSPPPEQPERSDPLSFTTTCSQSSYTMEDEPPIRLISSAPRPGLRSIYKPSKRSANRAKRQVVMSLTAEQERMVREWEADLEGRVRFMQSMRTKEKEKKDVMDEALAEYNRLKSQFGVSGLRKALMTLD